MIHLQVREGVAEGYGPFIESASEGIGPGSLSVCFCYSLRELWLHIGWVN